MMEITKTGTVQVSVRESGRHDFVDSIIGAGMDVSHDLTPKI